jgi:hypothetical protein
MFWSYIFVVVLHRIVVNARVLQLSPIDIDIDTPPPQIIKIQSPNEWSKEAIIALCSILVGLFGSFVKFVWPSVWTRCKKWYRKRRNTTGENWSTLPPLPALRGAAFFGRRDTTTDPILPLRTQSWTRTRDEIRREQQEEYKRSLGLHRLSIL